MSDHTFKFIHQAGKYGSVVELDGKALKNVRKVTIVAEVDEPTKIVVELVGDLIDAELSGETEMIVDVTNLESESREKLLIK